MPVLFLGESRYGFFEYGPLLSLNQSEVWAATLQAAYSRALIGFGRPKRALDRALVGS